MQQKLFFCKVIMKAKRVLECNVSRFCWKEYFTKKKLSINQ